MFWVEGQNDQFRGKNRATSLIFVKADIKKGC